MGTVDEEMKRSQNIVTENEGRKNLDEILNFI